MALAHPFDHFHLRAAPQGLPPFTPAPGSRRHSASSLTDIWDAPGSPLFLHRVRILQRSHRDQGWVRSRVPRLEQALCITSQIFRMQYSQLDCLVPNRSGSAFLSKVSRHKPFLGWWVRRMRSPLGSQLGFGRLPNMPTNDLHQGQLTCKTLCAWCPPSPLPPVTISRVPLDHTVYNDVQLLIR